MHSKSYSSIKVIFLASVLFFVPLLLTSNSAIAAVMVDINRADAATMIANWKGIGEKKAKAIIAYRKKNGPFASINDLSNVKGIGEGLIKKNRKYMSVKGGAKATKKSTTAKSTKKPADQKSTKKKSSTKKSTSKKKTDNKSTSSKSKSQTKKKKLKKKKQ